MEKERVGWGGNESFFATMLALIIQNSNDFSLLWKLAQTSTKIRKMISWKRYLEKELLIKLPNEVCSTKLAIGLFNFISRNDCNPLFCEDLFWRFCYERNIRPAFPKHQRRILERWITPQINQNWHNSDSITLSNLQLTHFCEWTPQSLVYLDLTANVLKFLPDSIGNLINLEELYIFNNLITKLPDSIGFLKSLKILYTNDNRLEALPESIGKLSKLESLMIFSNRLTILPDSFGSLSALKKLDAMYNELERLPESFGNLVNLCYIDLDENRLQYLPETIGNLVNLTELYLNQNQLYKLPSTMGGMKSLEWLGLECNNLSCLPESFSNLHLLSHGSVSGNPIDKLPQVLRDLPNLRSFWYDDLREFEESEESE
jgi:Leucine-rich repeat (LRR) protein